MLHENQIIKIKLNYLLNSKSLKALDETVNGNEQFFCKFSLFLCLYFERNSPTLSNVVL